jgi:hypothetical protein
MNENDLRTVLREAAVPVSLPDRFRDPSHVVAAVAARQRVRRRHLYTAAGTALGAAAMMTVAFKSWDNRLVPPHQPPTHSGAGTTDTIRSMDGTVSSIGNGILQLKDVTYALRAGDAQPPAQIPIPEGHWVTPTHWQSDAFTLDLFSGEKIAYLVDSAQIVPDLNMQYGTVLAADGDSVQLAIFDGPDSQHQVAQQTLRIPMYSRGRFSEKGRQLKPGDKVIVGWFGEPADAILWQLTFMN